MKLWTYWIGLRASADVTSGGELLSGKAEFIFILLGFLEYLPNTVSPDLMGKF